MPNVYKILMVKPVFRADGTRFCPQNGKRMRFCDRDDKPWVSDNKSEAVAMVKMLNEIASFCFFEIGVV